MTDFEENLRLKQRVKELESQNVKHMEDKSKWRNMAKGLLEEKRSWLGVCEALRGKCRIQNRGFQAGLKLKEEEVAELKQELSFKESEVFEEEQGEGL